MSITYPFAQTEFGDIVSIENVVRDSKVIYSCIECQRQLIANKGSIKAHYFSHKAKSNCSYESALHKIAKIVLKDSVGDHLNINSLLSKFRKKDTLGYYVCASNTVYSSLEIINVELEKQIKGTNMIADAIVTLSDLSIIIVEFCVTNKKTSDDIATLNHAGVTAIEVDLNGLISNDGILMPKDIKQYVLGGKESICISLGKLPPQTITTFYLEQLNSRNKNIKLQSINFAKWYSKNPQPLSKILPPVKGFGLSKEILVSKITSTITITFDYAEFYFRPTTSAANIGVRFYSDKDAHNQFLKLTHSPYVTLLRDTSNSRWIGTWSGIESWHQKLSQLAAKKNGQLERDREVWFRDLALRIHKNPHYELRAASDIFSDLPIGCPPPRRLTPISQPVLTDTGVYEIKCQCNFKFPRPPNSNDSVSMKIYIDEETMLSATTTGWTLMILVRSRNQHSLKWIGFSEGY